MPASIAISKEPATNAKSKTESSKAKKVLRAIRSRPILEHAKNYSVPESCLVTGAGLATIWRAIDLERRRPGEGLKHYRVGRRVIIRGEHLLAWLENGGKTGHGSK